MWEEVSTKVNINQLELELQYEKALAESVAEAARAEEAAASTAASPGEEAAPPAADPIDRTGNTGRLSISSSPSLIPRYSPHRQRKSIGAKLFNLPGKPIEPTSKLKSMPWLSKFIDYKFSLFDRTSKFGDGDLKVES